MARPTTRDERRSEALNIRVTPSLKAQLEAHARISGKKLSAEIEERLVQSMADTDAAVSSETRELLTEIQRVIGEIEQGSGKGWHEGVATWAAVAEMLATGPIMQRVPSELNNKDSRLIDLFDKLAKNSERRDEIKGLLGFAGLVTMQNSLSLHYAPSCGNRDDLRALADDRLPDHLKQNALAAIEALEAVDEDERQITAEIDALIEPFREAIEQGRKRYPKPAIGLVLKSALNRLNPPQTNALMQFAHLAPVREVLAGAGGGTSSAATLAETLAARLSREPRPGHLAGGLSALFVKPSEAE